MSDDFEDFGFTAVTLDELDLIQEQKKEVDNVTAEIDTVRAQLTTMREAIQPLLNNLKRDHEKDYIYWENRLPKIVAFEKHLDKIMGNNS